LEDGKSFSGRRDGHCVGEDDGQREKKAFHTEVKKKRVVKRKGPDRGKSQRKRV